MNSTFKLLSIQWRELWRSRSFYTALAICVLLFFYTGIYMDLQWRGYQVVAVDYGQKVGPAFFTSQWVFGYMVVLFCLTFTSSTTLMLNKSNEFTSLLFTKPISRAHFFVQFVAGTSLLMLVPFVLLNAFYWINFGITDGIWSGYIWLSMIPIGAACLIVVSSVLFFSLILSSNGIFPALAYCFIIPVVFSEKQKFLYPLSDNNLYRGAVDFTHTLFPSLPNILMVSANIFTQQSFDLSIKTTGVPYIILLLGAAYALFNQKNL